jgi:hypothetical protein
MKSIWLVPLACAVCMGATGELKVETSSRFNSTITAFNRLGEAILPARYLLADRPSSNSTTRTYGLFVIVDTSTERFQWMLLEPPSGMPEGLIRQGFEGGALAAHTSPDGVVIFNVGPGRLNILDAPGQARDLEDAETKALKAAAQAPGSELGEMSPRWRTVPLLGLDGFWALPLHANSGPLKILAVSRQEDGWNVLIEGQWKEMITLDGKYQLLKMQRVD